MLPDFASSKINNSEAYYSSCISQTSMLSENWIMSLRGRMRWEENLTNISFVSCCVSHVKYYIKQNWKDNVMKFLLTNVTQFFFVSHITPYTNWSTSVYTSISHEGHVIQCFTRYTSNRINKIKWLHIKFQYSFSKVHQSQ